MRTILKIVLIIIACLLFSYVLMRLFFMPFYLPTQPNSIKEAKKSNVFINEYSMDIIEAFDTTFQSDIFDNIFLRGTIYYDRNKFGIVHIAQNLENKWTKLVFVLDKEGNRQSYINAFIIQDYINHSFAGVDNGVIDMYFDSTRENYTIYLQTNPMSIAKETLIPIVKFKLVQKNQ